MSWERNAYVRAPSLPVARAQRTVAYESASILALPEALWAAMSTMIVSQSRRTRRGDGVGPAIIFAYVESEWITWKL